MGDTPATGNGRVRVVNLGTNGATGNADFCFRPSGSSSWGRPLLRDGGNDGLCAAGLTYQESTVRFSVPVGRIDVKAIPAGKTCAAAATSELDGVVIGDAITGESPAPPLTLVRWGNASKESITALPENPGDSGTDASYFRFVNVLASDKPINVGTADQGYLPTTLSSVGYPQPIAPASVEPAGATSIGPVNAQGYLDIIPALFKFGVSLASDAANNAIVVFTTSDLIEMASFYVGGDPADDTHPVQGLACADNVSLAQALATGAADAGPVAGDAGAGLTAQDAQLLAYCTPTRPPLISVDTFNVGLYGANAIYEQDRRPAVYAAITQRTSDVMCVVEVDDLTDRSGIASAAAAQYPYSYMVTTGLDTAFSNPADVKPPPTLAPCDPSIVASSTISNIYSCLNANCSTNPNDPTMSGTLNQTTECISDNCTSPFLPIYDKSVTINACFDCIIYYLTSEQKLSAGEEACTTDTRPPYAFLGQTPTMILSRYPLSNEHVYVLPSTGFRRAVLQATVTLENAQQFDFFCTQLTTPLIDSSIPYTGSFGKDNPSATPPENGWEDEQDFQVPEVISFVKKQIAADGLPAIVTADWQSTLGSGAGDAGLASLSPEVMTALEASTTGFVEAAPPGYTPVCDYCPNSGATPNLYNASTEPLSVIDTFLVGFPAGSTQSRSLWGTGNVVTITGSPSAPPPPGGVGPLSDTFPTNVTILRPPAK